MTAKSKNSKIIIFFIIFSIISSQKVDDNDESQILEGILEAMKNLKISYKSLDDEINHKTYIKLLKYLVLNEADSFGILNDLEDAFLFKLSKEVTENVPDKIKIKDLPKYLNPRKIEPLINNVLNEFDFTSMLKNLGDTLGITDIFKETMEESRKKDIEREKINQARIKRNQEREKANLNQNGTNINETNDGNKIKNKKRDFKNNESDADGINKDL